jgi:hypothetical protein
MARAGAISRRVWILMLPALAAMCTVASARTLRVGPAQALRTPSAAAEVVRDGDIVEIEAGTYAGDVATWRANRLTLRGRGQVVLEAAGKSAQGKGIWVIAGRRTTVENIVFTGAKVPDKNGAGIRQEGAGLVVRGCTFRDNENGILTGENRQSDILIERSTFVGAGAGDGQSHNIYIGAVRSFTLRASVVREARVGHEVKSRALRNDIRYNRIDDGAASASYSIDLPNGGDSTIVGNLIVQGPNSENSGIISYGAEGLANGSSRLRIASNTIVNRQVGRGVVAQASPGTDVLLWNNAISGGGTLSAIPAKQRANVTIPVPVVAGKERPGRRSRLVDRAAPPPADLLPRFEPGGAPRRVRGRLDIGAYEST